METDYPVPVEREILLNIDNYVDALGTRRKSRRMLNEESIIRIKESNRSKIKEETDRQLMEEEERLIFKEVLRRIQKRKDMKLKNEFYDFEKLKNHCTGMITPRKGEKRAGGEELSRDKSSTMLKFKDESKEHITSKELKIVSEANRSRAASMTTYINFEYERKLRDEKERKSREESERKTIERQNSKTDRDLNPKLQTLRKGFSEDILGARNEGKVERIREVIEMNIKPERRKTTGGDMVANQKMVKEANDKKIREKNVSKLMQEYEKNIKFEIEIKLALEREKKTRSTRDIYGVITNTKRL